MSKTTLDLSTISDITDGTHTVKVKAKADGYRDSEFSNEVSYTKSSKQIVTLQATSNAGFVYSVDTELTTSVASEVIGPSNTPEVLQFDTLPTYIEVAPYYYSWLSAPTATGATVAETSRRFNGPSNGKIYRITNITNGAIVDCPVSD